MSKYVSKDFCDERFKRILEMLEQIDKKLDKAEKDRIQNNTNKRESFSAWRSFAFAIVGGSLVAFITWLLRIIPL